MLLPRAGKGHLQIDLLIKEPCHQSLRSAACHKIDGKYNIYENEGGKYMQGSNDGLGAGDGDVQFIIWVEFLVFRTLTLKSLQSLHLMPLC